MAVMFANKNRPVLLVFSHTLPMPWALVAVGAEFNSVTDLASVLCFQAAALRVLFARRTNRFALLDIYLEVFDAEFAFLFGSRLRGADDRAAFGLGLGQFLR